MKLLIAALTVFGEFDFYSLLSGDFFDKRVKILGYIYIIDLLPKTKIVMLAV